MKKKKIWKSKEIHWEIEGSLPDVIEVLNKYLKEYGPKARLDISIREEPYGGEYAVVELEWEVMETDEEAKARIVREKEEQERRDQWDRDQFERLSKKFNKSP